MVFEPPVHGAHQAVRRHHRPQDSCTRLQLESAVRVVFHLCSDDGEQTIGSDREFVLSKRGVQIVRSTIRYEGRRRYARDLISAHTVARAPDEVVTPPLLITMLKVHVERVSLFGHWSFIARGSVEIRLQLEVAAGAEWSSPSCQHIAATKRRLTR